MENLLCPTCHKTATPDGLWCQACGDTLRRALASIADHCPDLQDALLKRTRFASSGISSHGDDQPLPWNPRARETFDLARVVLVGWTRVLCEDCDIDPPENTIPAICQWLREQLPRLRRHEAAYDAWTEIVDLNAEITTTIDRPQDREYLGDCTSPECAALHLAITCKPGAHEAVCRRCGTVYDADLTREQRRRWSDDQLVTQADLAKVYPKQTVSDWVKSGKLPIHGMIEGKPVFNLGDARVLRERGEDKKPKTRRVRSSR